MRRLFTYHCPYCNQDDERLTDGSKQIECRKCGMTAEKQIAGSALKTNSANKFKPA